jgi:hypothetical protein
MDNAIKYGYKFEIIQGYEFQKGNVFKEYIEKLYQLRLQYPKTHPMNYIAKLLMNSLYGKFGMKMESTEVMVFDVSNEVGKTCFKETFDLWSESVIDLVEVDNYIILIRQTLMAFNYNEEQDMFHGLDINIAIATAITSYARIHMSKFKNYLNFNLYYSDTDSIVIDSPLPNEMVGNNLGQVKLEHIINKAIFLALAKGTKVYALEDEDGTITIKIKGVKKEVTEEIGLDMFEYLLVKDSSKEFKQFKWFKKILQGEITIDQVAYTLKATSNKRMAIYQNINGLDIFTGTRPYNYDNIIDQIDNK